MSHTLLKNIIISYCLKRIIIINGDWVVLEYVMFDLRDICSVNRGSCNTGLTLHWSLGLHCGVDVGLTQWQMTIISNNSLPAE